MLSETNISVWYVAFELRSISFHYYDNRCRIYNIDVELVESEKSKVVQSLNVIADKLTITSRSVSDGRAQQLLIDTYGDVSLNNIT